MGVRGTRTYVSKVPIEDLDVAVYEFERDELVVLVAYLAYEEEGGVAAVYDLPGFEFFATWRANSWTHTFLPAQP